MNGAPNPNSMPKQTLFSQHVAGQTVDNNYFVKRIVKAVIAFIIVTVIILFSSSSDQPDESARQNRSSLQTPGSFLKNLFSGWSKRTTRDFTSY